MQTKENDVAFPSTIETANGYLIAAGLTKREYFAIQIMNGILAAADFPFEMAAKEAVRLTDKLIVELNKTASNEEPNTEEQPTQEAGTEA